LLQDGYSVLVNRADGLSYQADYLVAERRYSEATQLRNQAKEIYKQAIQLQPNNPLAYDRIGLIYSSLGQRKEAVEMFSRAIELDHNYSSAYFHLGLEYREQGNNQEAVIAFKQAIRLNPIISLAYFCLGLTYRKL
jgi:tetratricopeptide (TPR) repeat protein